MIVTWFCALIGFRYCVIENVSVSTYDNETEILGIHTNKDAKNMRAVFSEKVTNAL